MSSSLPLIHYATEVCQQTSRAPTLQPALLELDYDILVVPGDLGQPVEQAIPLLASLNKPVVLTLGNKDLRGSNRSKGYTMTERVATAKALAAGTQVYVLERDEVVIQGVRFLGAHLGFGVHGHHPVLAKAFLGQYNDIYNLDYADLMADDRVLARAKHFFEHRSIMEAPYSTEVRHDNPAFIVALISAAYERDLQWIRNAAHSPFPGPTVVVTHAAPDDTFAKLRGRGLRKDKSEEVARFFKATDRRDYDAALYALNSNDGLASVPFVDIWAFGQSDVNAMALGEGGISLVSAGFCNASGYLAIEPTRPHEIALKLHVHALQYFHREHGKALQDFAGLVRAITNLRRDDVFKFYEGSSLESLARKQAFELAMAITDLQYQLPLLNDKGRKLVSKIQGIFRNEGIAALRNCQKAFEALQNAAPVTLFGDIKKVRKHKAIIKAFVQDAAAKHGWTASEIVTGMDGCYLQRSPLFMKIEGYQPSDPTDEDEAYVTFQRLESEWERELSDRYRNDGHLIFSSAYQVVRLHLVRG